MPITLISPNFIINTGHWGSKILLALSFHILTHLWLLCSKVNYYVTAWPHHEEKFKQQQLALHSKDNHNWSPYIILCMCTKAILDTWVNNVQLGKDPHPPTNLSNILIFISLQIQLFSVQDTHFVSLSWSNEQINIKLLDEIFNYKTQITHLFIIIKLYRIFLSDA